MPLLHLQLDLFLQDEKRRCARFSASALCGFSLPVSYSRSQVEHDIPSPEYSCVVIGVDSGEWQWLCRSWAYSAQSCGPSRLSHCFHGVLSSCSKACTYKLIGEHNLVLVKCRKCPVGGDRTSMVANDSDQQLVHISLVTQSSSLLALCKSFLS